MATRFIAVVQQVRRSVPRRQLGLAQPNPRRRALPSPLTVTPSAAERLRGLLSSKPDAYGVLVGVRRRGCNGMSYTLNYADEKPPTAYERIPLDNGQSVYIDPPALFHIVGTVMDYEVTELSSGFTFTNPNEKGRCGCGESFNV
ncbi:hypothetical protein CTAYLR_006976 [Chrysophaeum taylorii]|uniref:Core domain-containing protein n=1 Tax=Chrysophaeum taylorii TaxID=2483200 RepID=A0AAD7UA86_9STRA|nr:hypothetical protein CTAYLR_006976 [Chrysophaeum taylorii]